MLAVASRLCGLHARIMSSTGGQCSMRLWHAALSTSRRYLRPAVWQKYFGITIEELDRLTEAVAAALDGRVMTREELVQEVRRLTGSAAFGAKVAESSWGTLRVRQAWMLAAYAREVREIPRGRSVRLLPGFDQYVVAASCHAEHLLPGDLRHRVYRPQGWISPVLPAELTCTCVLLLAKQYRRISGQRASRRNPGSQQAHKQHDE